MSELSETGQATKEDAKPSLKFELTIGSGYKVQISADDVHLGLVHSVSLTALGFGAIYAGYKMMRPLIDAAVKKALGGPEREEMIVPINDQLVNEINTIRKRQNLDMNDEEKYNQFTGYNFPPDSPVIEEVDGKITCDLTSYDPPPRFPSNIFSHQNLQVLKLLLHESTTDIPEELGNLLTLEHLVLWRCESDVKQGMNRTKIPETLRRLRNLKILDLRNNLLVLDTFPQHLTELTNLEELHVNNCQLTSLPDSFGSLKKLKTLDVSNNLFKDFPLCITKLHNLCKLFLSSGCLQSVCEEIKNLVNLERLQLTSNELASLPKGLFELVNLRKLYLSNNKLASLPDELGNLVKLEYLVLNSNKLTKVPETIGELKQLHYLNLHENLLSALPESITKLEQIETLIVGKNPFQEPPDHVCNQGIQSIKNYFQAMKNTKRIHSKQLKVMLLGEPNAGKTSLVHTLTSGESTQIDEADRTFGVMFYHWKPEPDIDELELMVVDCAGQTKYQMTHQLFLSEGALFILAVNLSRYILHTPESYQEHVGQWISLVAARIPRARILVVPTHIDNCREEIDLKCQNILTNIKEQRKEMVSQGKFVKKAKGHYDLSQDFAKKHHREQKDNLPVISLKYKEINENLDNNLAMAIIPVSNATLDGIDQLRKELVRIAMDKNLSPNIDINLPESWVKIRKEIKTLRTNVDIPCLSMNELQKALKEQAIDVSECELRSCVSYLGAIGELLYFKDIDGLVKNVVINPYWLGSVLKKIFRHDMDEHLKYGENFRKVGIVKIQFDQDKEKLLKKGVIEQRLLKCIWSEFLEKSDTIFPQLVMMLAHFGLACEVPDSCLGRSPASYLVPWYFPEKRPKSLDHNWTPLADSRQVQVTTVFAFPQYLPLALFAQFSVLCHNHEPDDHKHWRNGFYMKFGDVLICSDTLSCQKCETLKVAGRAPKKQFDALWRILLILLEEIEKLLKEWPGINFVRCTACPVCVQNGVSPPQYFEGNWFVHKRTRRPVCTKQNPSHEVPLDLLRPSADVLKSYREPVAHSSEIPDCILGDDLLDTIADMLGTRWPRLARKLDLSTKVDSIEVDYRGNTHEQAAIMLTKWKQKHGSNAKIKVVIKALRELELNDIVDYILGAC